MKTFFIFFTVVSLVVCIAGRCSYGCTCYSDDVCEYYCQGYQCQSQIPWGSSCSGYSIHSRECGSASYCDDSSYICQWQKISGSTCLNGYECISNYCDPDTFTCDYESYFRAIYVIIPVIVVIAIVLVFVGICVRRRRRIIVTNYPVQCQSQSQGQNVCTILPGNNPYMYPNPPMGGGMLPPPYSDPKSTPYRV